MKIKSLIALLALAPILVMAQTGLPTASSTGKSAASMAQIPATITNAPSVISGGSANIPTHTSSKSTDASNDVIGGGCDKHGTSEKSTSKNSHNVDQPCIKEVCTVC
jgi:hypothetical protein